MTTIVSESTPTTCPNWCTVDHAGLALDDGSDHAHTLADGPLSVDICNGAWGEVEVRLWANGDPAGTFPADDALLEEMSRSLHEAAQNLRGIGAKA